MSRVVMYSGGVSSWGAAKRTVERHGAEGITLLFCDTKTEHPDTYRFLKESARNIGAPLVTLADGRTIWEVFRSVRFLGNSRADPCSRILKREIGNRWLLDNCDPKDTTLVFGLDWTEPPRAEKIVKNQSAWRCEFPLMEPPYLTKIQLREWAVAEGIADQELYRIGAPHANCGGGCVKMGIGGWARVLRTAPEVYSEWERQEEAMRAELGDVSMLTDRRAGARTPMPLKALRARLESGEEVDLFDIGACDCFAGVSNAR